MATIIPLKCAARLLPCWGLKRVTVHQWPRGHCSNEHRFALRCQWRWFRQRQMSCFWEGGAASNTIQSFFCQHLALTLVQQQQQLKRPTEQHCDRALISTSISIAFRLRNAVDSWLQSLPVVYLSIYLSVDLSLCRFGWLPGMAHRRLSLCHWHLPGLVQPLLLAVNPFNGLPLLMSPALKWISYASSIVWPIYRYQVVPLVVLVVILFVFYYGKSVCFKCHLLRLSHFSAVDVVFIAVSWECDILLILSYPSDCLSSSCLAVVWL